MNVFLDPLRTGLAAVLVWLPQLIGALLVIWIGYYVVKLVERVVEKALQRSRFDGLLHRGTAGSYVARLIDRPTQFVGSIVFWVLWLGVLSVAIRILGIPGLTDAINVIYAYLPNVLAALLIFLVAGAVSAAVAGMVTKVMGETPTGRLVAAVVPAVTMTIAVFMILTQLRIAPVIVTITYAALIGAVALGMALAFGIGGREVAARLLEQAYTSGQRGLEQAKQDARLGKQRATAAAKDAASANPLEEADRA